MVIPWRFAPCPSCCVQVCPCRGHSEEYDIDFGVGGWTSEASEPCSEQCVDFSGIVTVTKSGESGDGGLCQWEYRDDDGTCTFLVRFDLYGGAYFGVCVDHALAKYQACVQVYLWENPGVGEGYGKSLVRYRSADFDFGDPCPDPFTLTKEAGTESHYLMCTGTLPATITATPA